MSLTPPLARTHTSRARHQPTDAQVLQQYAVIAREEQPGVLRKVWMLVTAAATPWGVTRVHAVMLSYLANDTPRNACDLDFVSCGWVAPLSCISNLFFLFFFFFFFFFFFLLPILWGRKKKAKKKKKKKKKTKKTSWRCRKGGRPTRTTRSRGRRRCGECRWPGRTASPRGRA
eukprot:TRINITY_DN10618_c0_g1_i4.p1 TRINITY_DN10618_c0_g1~~TRINITY_DN10618_c0_g1_i4.p1  ORF type:complete len:173 (+),score=65.17 TRINITY_DN10618_c0_g1_i4:213-731(+)